MAALAFVPSFLVLYLSAIPPLGVWSPDQTYELSIVVSIVQIGKLKLSELIKITYSRSHP